MYLEASFSKTVNVEKFDCRDSEVRLKKQKWM